MKTLPHLFAGTALIALSVHLSVPLAAHAQTAPQDNAAQDPVLAEPEGEDVYTGNEIVVTGRSLRGTIQAAEAPILELDQADIAAYGAGSIAELVEQLAPQTSSGRGRGGADGHPVFLVNGLRVSSFREFRSYPPEAIEKVEVLPEEVAQQYGFPPNRRVMNFIMKQNYSSKEVELEYRMPGDGGFARPGVELTYLQLGEGNRLNLNAEYEYRSILTEAERDIVQSTDSVSDVAGDPDPAAFRSLVGEIRQAELTGNYTTRLGESATTLSVNGTYERDEGRTLSGLNSVTLTDPDGNFVLRTFGADNGLERRSKSDTLSFGTTVNTANNGWDIDVTGNASRAWSVTEIDRRADTQALVDAAAAGELAIDGPLPAIADAGFDTARTRSTNADLLSTFRGSFIDLPAGPLSTTFDAGYSWTNIRSEDTRTVLPADGITEFTRGTLSAGANLSAPVFDNESIGYATINASAGVDHLSDFGTLGDWTLGATWNPTDRLSITGSYIVGEAAPSLSQLGDPVTQTLNVPVYDFTTGETVLTTITSGGNANLVAEDQRDWKVGVNWELPFTDGIEFLDQARLVAEYFNNSSTNVTASFPLLTPDIEAAFPGRVTRAADGTLLAIDRTPITLARQDSQRLSFGLNLRGSLGGSDESEPAAERPERAERAARSETAAEGSEGARQGFQPSEEQRQAFMALRTQMCGDDGMDFLRRLVSAVEAGETVPELPDMDPAMLARILDRARGEDGTIDEARLETFRTRFCAFDPSQMGGGRQTGAENGGAQVRGGGGRGGGRGMGRRGGGDGEDRGRWFANITYNRELDNTVLIADGGPLLDLLDGDALTGGGVTRDSATLQAGVFKGGLGLRVSGDYSGPSRVNGSGLPGSGDLFFGSLTTFDLRVFADLGRVIGDEGFWKGTRVSLRADNVFDTRRTVTDASGEVPLSYQPFLIDPVGRYLGVEFRKLF
jgi:outer membrane receptor protein involved in Fe transport